MKTLSKTQIGIVILLGFLLIFSAGYNYHLYDKGVSDSSKRIDSLITQQKNWQLQLNQLEIPIDSINLGREAQLFLKLQKLELENKIVEQGRQINQLSNELKESHEEWYSGFLKYYGIIGVVIGFLGVFGGIKYFQDKMMSEMATILKLNKNELKLIWEAKIKNRKLREAIKIKVLTQKGSEFSEDFKKLMEIFNVDVTKTEKIIYTDGLREVYKKVIEEDFDILVIENKATKAELQNALWPLADTKGMAKDDLKKISETACGDERNKAENALALIELADKICTNKKMKAIIYYGDRHNGFPSNLVDEKNQHRITFANAASQLYENINNMIQYLHEIGELKTEI